MATQFGYTDLALGATETTYTDIGDITVPEGASRITGICAEIAQETGYAAAGMLGVAKLEFQGAEELDGIPVNTVGTVDTGQVFYVPEFIPVNIPVIKNRPIACAIKETIAQTGTTQHGKICLRFE